MMFVWERNGLQIDSVEGTDQLQLYISEVEQAHAGTYTCRVVLTPQTSGAIMNLGPASAGTLTVLGMCIATYMYMYMYMHSIPFHDCRTRSD